MPLPLFNLQYFVLYKLSVFKQKCIFNINIVLGKLKLLLSAIKDAILSVFVNPQFEAKHNEGVVEIIHGTEGVFHCIKLLLPPELKWGKHSKNIVENCIG